jgi:prolyl oligopeptidase
MKLFILLSVVILAACSSTGRPTRTAARPPATRIEPVTDTLHGVQIVDNYRWLEGNNANPSEQGQVTPEVAAWTDAQNSYTREVPTSCRAVPGSRRDCGH